LLFNILDTATVAIMVWLLGLVVRLRRWSHQRVYSTSSRY